MLIKKIETPVRTVFHPRTLQITAETENELRLLVGFLFLDRLVEDPSTLHPDAAETLVELRNGYNVNECVRALAKAVDEDFSLTPEAN